MKGYWLWILLGIGVIYLLKQGPAFTGVTPQRGTFGTPGVV